MSAETPSVDPDDPGWDPRPEVRAAIDAAQHATLDEDGDRLEAAALSLLAVSRRAKQEGWR